MTLPNASKEEWFKRFRLTGFSIVQDEYHQDRWKHIGDNVHAYAREWLDLQIGLQESEAVTQLQSAQKQFQLAQAQFRADQKQFREDFEQAESHHLDSRRQARRAEFWAIAAIAVALGAAVATAFQAYYACPNPNHPTPTQAK